MLGLTAPDIALALSIVFVAAVLQGAAGLGYALIAASLLALVDPALAPQAVLGTGSLLSLLVAMRERHAVAPAEIGWALAGYLPGAVLAAMLLARLLTTALSLLFAALVLLAVALSTLRPRLIIAAATLLPAGLLSGFMGTTSSIAGPPMALLYQNSEGDHIRATLGLYFVGGGILSIALLSFAGRFGPIAAAHNLLLLPGTVLGFALSGPLHPRPRPRTHPPRDTPHLRRLCPSRHRPHAPPALVPQARSPVSNLQSLNFQSPVIQSPVIQSPISQSPISTPHFTLPPTPCTLCPCQKATTTHNPSNSASTPSPS